MPNYIFPKSEDTNIEALNLQLKAQNFISESITWDSFAGTLELFFPSALTLEEQAAVAAIVALHLGGDKYSPEDENYEVQMQNAAQGFPCCTTWYKEKVNNSYTIKVREIMYEYQSSVQQMVLIAEVENKYDSAGNIWHTERQEYYVDPDVKQVITERT